MNAAKDQTQESSASPEIPGDSGDLTVRLGGFEGPLDLLLNLAHEQKVDLAALSISALAEQYLAYINAARRLRLEIAADYLVMAAWLAFLKSRLLLPAPPGAEEPPPGDMAEALKFQLRRLEAMQNAAAALQTLPQLGHEVFMRGIPEPIRRVEKPVYDLKLYDLLQALAAPQRRKKPARYQVPAFRLLSVEDAMARLRAMLGFMPEWADMQAFVPELAVDAVEARSSVASIFAASLEMAKLGLVELRQDAAFAPIYLRKAPDPALNEEDAA